VPWTKKVDKAACGGRRAAADDRRYCPRRPHSPADQCDHCRTGNQSLFVLSATASHRTCCYLIEIYYDDNTDNNNNRYREFPVTPAGVADPPPTNGPCRCLESIDCRSDRIAVDSRSVAACILYFWVLGESRGAEREVRLDTKITIADRPGAH
jgi:hypothetical protein